MTATKLTKQQQTEIREKYRQRQLALERTKNFTVRALAKSYGVGTQTVWRLVEIDSWALRETNADPQIEP